MATSHKAKCQMRRRFLPDCVKIISRKKRPLLLDFYWHISMIPYCLTKGAFKKNSGFFYGDTVQFLFCIAVYRSFSFERILLLRK